jgi:hypothetical protein
MKRLSSANRMLILSFLLLSFGPRVFAQLGAAGISGAVTDQQNAAVVGADVTVKNKATGQAHRTIAKPAARDLGGQSRSARFYHSGSEQH